MSKIDSMMAILWLLKSGRKMTAKQLSEKLEMNIRTVYRYMDALSASGVPIISDPGHNGGYSLLHDFIESPLLFSVEEKTALLQAADFAKKAGYYLDEDLERATSKLKTRSNQDQDEKIRQHLEGLEVLAPVDKSAAEPLLKELEQAVLNQASIDMWYQTGREEQPKHRLVDPYGIIYWSHNWYVIAFCHLKKEIRSFRTSRIKGLTQTEKSFIRPEPFSAGEFFMRTLIPESEAGNPDEFIPLVISGKISALDNLCQHWYLAHHLKERSSGQAVFSLTKEALYTFIPNLLLPYGRAIQIMEPPSLKQKMIEVLNDLLHYYQE